MVHLVTGFAGQAHVASEDDGSKQAAIVGTGRYVANVGSEFEATIKSNNLVRIADGDLFNQGRHIRIPTNSYEEVTISNGSQGVNRNDLIVMRYEKNTSNGIETAALKVIKGTAGSTAKDPEYTQGDILAGDYVDEFPLYRVKITGLSITAVEPMFEILLPMAEMYSRLNGKLKFGMWSATSIPTASWTTIADFTLPAGLYMIMASVNVASVSAPNAIMGIRLLNNGGAESQKIENYISNQENGMSFFTFVNLTQSTSTAAVQFFHNTGQSIYVGRRHVCVIPVSNTDLI